MQIETFQKTKKAIQNIVDMPDNKIDLLIKLTLQNKGRLAPSKRAKFFAMLTEKEIAAMERAVQKHMTHLLQD